MHNVYMCITVFQICIQLTVKECNCQIANTKYELSSMDIKLESHPVSSSSWHSKQALESTSILLDRHAATRSSTEYRNNDLRCNETSKGRTVHQTTARLNENALKSRYI